MAKAVQISLDEELLRRVDADPETKRRGRSAVVSAALLLYLQKKRRQAVDEAILSAYGDVAGEMARDVEPILRAQTWPKR
jgi:metal-responsive CopG/Arc/MetJ family transcriptional regulator